jgi:hypothetical protein
MVVGAWLMAPQTSNATVTVAVDAGTSGAFSATCPKEMILIAPSTVKCVEDYYLILEKVLLARWAGTRHARVKLALEPSRNTWRFILNYGIIGPV